MATIILIPGAYHGGWYFTPLLAPLRAAGHDVHTITLTGLAGTPSHASSAINLDTHINDLTNLIAVERLENIVLCGHSYGGMVIAGAADRMADRVRTMLFLDALVPDDGDSVWSIFGSPLRDKFVEAAPDGLLTRNPPETDARARPHPLATFLQPIRLSAQAYSVTNKVFAWCSSSGGPFEDIYHRLAIDPDWVTHKLDCGHDIMNDAPDLALALLMETAAL